MFLLQTSSIRGQINGFDDSVSCLCVVVGSPVATGNIVVCVSADLRKVMFTRPDPSLTGEEVLMPAVSLLLVAFDVTNDPPPVQYVVDALVPELTPS